MFGFWAHFAAQNRAFRSNLLRKFRFNPLALGLELPVPPPVRPTSLLTLNCYFFPVTSSFFLLFF
jgi:hypothetical protein